MTGIVSEKKWVRTGPVPRSLRDRSRYDPHQSIRERMRRVGQLVREGGELDEAMLGLYVDYSTAKAAGQSLVRFSQKPVVEPAQGLLDGIPGVTILPETGPDPAPAEAV